MRSPSERLHFGTGIIATHHQKHSPFFTSSFILIILVFTVSCTKPFVSSSLTDSLRKVPTLKILEYDEAGKFVRNTLSIYPDSDLVLADEYSEEEDRIRSKKIVLECSASYPVQFSYEGSGTPDYIENSIVDENYFDEKTGKSSARFSTSLSFPSNLQEHDTGKYACTNMIAENVSSSVFLFIPGSGKVLFASSESTSSQRKMFFSRNESSVRIDIPCGVTHPNVLVSLHKFDGTYLLHYPVNDSVGFNPKTGFHIVVNSHRSDPSGIYICAAALNDAFQIIEYQVLPLDGSSVVSNALADLSAKDGKRSCFSENDCSADTACIARQCQSPCTLLPTTCEDLKLCQTVNHQPVCRSVVDFGDDNVETSGTDVDIFRTDFGSPFSASLRSACNPTVCGRNAECVVLEYKAYCVCFEGYTGNGIISCHRMSDQLAEIRDPCSTANCGLHTTCTEINGHAVCSCLSEFNGYPPHCREETYCSSNDDCPDDLHCNRRSSRCEEPCESFDRRPCAPHAFCKVKSHSAYCLCKPGFTGNPHSKCVPVRNIGPLPSHSPCQPSPCGNGALCRIIRDEVPYCYCPSGTRGNPRVRCYSTNEKLQSSTTVRPRPVPSRPSPSLETPHSNSPCDVAPNCGPNAACRVVNGLAACKCNIHYEGDPYTSGCFPGKIFNRPSPGHSSHHPGKYDVNQTTTQPPLYIPPTQSGGRECRINQNCPENKACYNFKCVNPCRGSCGSGARCKIVNHTPLCSCPEGTIGDGLVSCQKQSSLETSDPCASCGPNSNCKIVSRFVHCQCNPWSTGSPPKCRRADCTSNSQCPEDKACIENACVNPCTYRGNGNRNHTCAPGAHCKAVNHEATCVCPTGFTGDGRTSCREIQMPPQMYNPCERAPCGQHSTCQIIVGLVNYRRCTCNEGYYFTYYGCRKEDNPCRYSPCGPNGLCSSSEGIAYCRCDGNSVGTPPFCAPKLAFGGRWSYIPIIE